MLGSDLLATYGKGIALAVRDEWRQRRQPAKPRLHGLYLYEALPGQGKTLSVTERLDALRLRWGDAIYISTNYGYKGEDFAFDHWRDFLVRWEKPIVYGVDELGFLFNSRSWSDFPPELVVFLAQRRKWGEGGAQVLGTVQRHFMVDKNLRELADYIIDCRLHFGRVVVQTWYHGADYEKGAKWEERFTSRRRFVATDELFSHFDSWALLDRFAQGVDPQLRAEARLAEAQRQMAERFWQDAPPAGRPALPRFNRRK